jgi:hypothetical protein
VTFGIDATAGVAASVTLSCGIVYDWDEGRESRASFCQQSNDPLGVTADTAVTASLQASLEASLTWNETIGIQGSLTGRLEAEYRPAQRPQGTVRASLRASLAACLVCFWNDSPLSVNVVEPEPPIIDEVIATFGSVDPAPPLPPTFPIDPNDYMTMYVHGPAGPNGEAVACLERSGRWITAFRTPNGELLGVRLPPGVGCSFVSDSVSRGGAAWSDDGVAFIPTEAVGVDGVAAISSSGLLWHTQDLPESADTPQLAIGGDGELYALQIERSFEGSDYLSRLDRQNGTVLETAAVSGHGSAAIYPTANGLATAGFDRAYLFDGVTEVASFRMGEGNYLMGAWANGVLTAVSGEIISNAPSDVDWSCTGALTTSTGGAPTPAGEVDVPYDRCNGWFVKPRPGGGLVVVTAAERDNLDNVWVVSWIDSSGTTLQQREFVQPAPSYPDLAAIDVDKNGAVVFAVAEYETCVSNGEERPCAQAHLKTLTPDGDLTDRRLGTLTQNTRVVGPPLISGSTILVPMVEENLETGEIYNREIRQVSAPELSGAYLGD